MAEIHVLNSETINRIAAGEVVERPTNVVKELVENAIDAGADAVTVEIQGGGIDLIRVTDNGCGIDPSEVSRAFLRHATSKITDADDLLRLGTLGFRGEALSSIAAVSEVEMITRTRDSLFGIRAVNGPAVSGADADSMEGGTLFSRTPADAGENRQTAMQLTEIGAPDGTTVIVRNLFYNVPVRRGFLKSAQTEGSYVTDLIEHLALSHPEVSFHYRMNRQEKLHTTGNGNIREIIYRIYGREMSRSVVPFAQEDIESGISISGYLGRPEFSRSSRSFEQFYVNGRMLKSEILSKGLEEGYRTDLMQHRFPFAIIYLSVPPERIDVNIHPSKMEVRFYDPKGIYDLLNESVHAALHKEELIPHETPDTKSEETARERAELRERELAQKAQPHIEAFELRAQCVSDAAPVYGALSRRPDEAGSVSVFEEEDFSFVDKTARYAQQTMFDEASLPSPKEAAEAEDARLERLSQEIRPENPEAPAGCDLTFAQAEEGGDLPGAAEGASYFGDSRRAEPHLLTRENARQYKYIGQVFDTYWIIEFDGKMLMIDQHAAHEKVNFERLMARLEREKSEPAASQMLMPPAIVSLSGREEAALGQYMEYFRKMGYEIEPFGENTYALRAVPAELYGNDPDALLKEILDEILESRMSGTPAAILYKIASMSCKAAIKGNTRMSVSEAKDLIDELLSLDNPYHCPHGRPTMIMMAQSEIDRKFKRIV